ncbi:hypothetical protein CXB51_003914 [Gossypium anomalum]|uniref:Uncharacterized protein n=1 Tax=Gossypium anomalum TaxID=47600 RepID=A0A8J5Z7T5_9ROSI|nr:hypothetical protein CXB51_003914 [Gossypium anomalum]
MILAYVSVKWWKLFTPEQCAGINKFVANFSIPLLSFQFPGWFIVHHNRLSLSTMPNTLILESSMVASHTFGSDCRSTKLNLLNATKAASDTTVAVFTSLRGRRGPEEAQGKREEKRHNESKEIQDNADFLDSGEEANGKSQYPCYLTWSYLGKHSIQWRTWYGNVQLSSTLSTISSAIAINTIQSLGIRMAAVAMIMKFIAGPALMAAASTTLGLKGKLLRVAMYRLVFVMSAITIVLSVTGNLWYAYALPVALVYYLLLALF